MTAKITDLPHFVRRQVELATRKLVDGLYPKKLLIEFHGNRVLVIELKPHPTKPEEIRFPLALLDFKTPHWVLLFRGNGGQWQPLPEQDLLLSLDAKIEAILADDYGVFWRQ